MRYQFSENIRTLRAVIPAIMLNAMFFTIGLYFVISYLFNANFLNVLPNTQYLNATMDDVRKAVEKPISESFMFKVSYFLVFKIYIFYAQGK